MCRSIAVLSFTFLLGMCTAGGAQPSPEAKTCALHVQITDEDDGVINRAFVLIHSGRSANVNQQVTLNPRGAFKINLRSGLYDLFVASAGFMPVAQIVDLRSCKPLDVNLMLLVDSEHADDDHP